MQRLIAELTAASESNAARLEAAIGDGKRDLRTLGDVCLWLCVGREGRGRERAAGGPRIAATHWQDVWPAAPGLCLHWALPTRHHPLLYLPTLPTCLPIYPKP